MKNWIVALGALAMVGSGCSPVVLEPLEGTQDPIATVSGSTVLAIRGGAANWQDNFELAPGKGAPWSDPDSLVLFFSSDPQVCSDPVLANRCVGAPPFWQTVIAIPPELNHPGLIDLHDPRINGYSVLSAFDDAFACSGGGARGSILSGTLELIGDGSTSLSVKIEGSGKLFAPTEDLDGDYTCQLCGELPPVPPPTPAFAVRGADLPPGIVTAATPDPDSLVVVLGLSSDACANSLATADCSTSSRLTFTLPLSLQMPGVLSLSDPAIAAAYTLAGSGGSAICGQPDGSLVSGTIEILDSDAAGLTFKIYQSLSETTVPDSRLAFDGLYVASICP
jgi:hypothetical protein